jgi:hypothetical protein
MLLLKGGKKQLALWREKFMKLKSRNFSTSEQEKQLIGRCLKLYSKKFADLPEVMSVHPFYLSFPKLFTEFL